MTHEEHCDFGTTAPREISLVQSVDLHRAVGSSFWLGEAAIEVRRRKTSAAAARSHSGNFLV